jgi:hypothetical protein
MDFAYRGVHIKAGVDDAPADSGASLTESVDIAGIVPDYTDSSSSNDKRLAMMGWSEDVQEEVQAYRSKVDRVEATTLTTTIGALHQAHLDNRKSHEDRVDTVVKAYWDDYTTILTEKVEAADSIKGEYEMKVALQKQEDDQSFKDILTNGTLSTLATGGLSSGIVFKGVLDWIEHKMTQEKITEPLLPSQEILIKSASKEAGLGTKPELGLRSLGGKLYADLIVADIETSRTIHSAYLSLLRRGLHDPDDALKLAESASLCRADAEQAMAGAKKIWEKPSAKRRQHVQAIHEDAEDHYKEIGNTLVLTYATMVLAERTTNHTGMSSSAYLESVRNYYPEIDDDAISAIDDAVVKVEPPSEEWTSVQLRYVLSTLFGNEGVFNGFLTDPAMLATDCEVTYTKQFKLPLP